MVNLRGGRRWFAVESKSFEILIDEVGGVERIEVGPSSGRRREGSTIGASFKWGRKISALFCARFRGKTFLLSLSRREGLTGGWNILAEKLREVGVVPTGGSKKSCVL
ncbi:hypothetical protein CK203_030068 [Vitis vinifera]|uniref:Uncharacterized protein n=1 Tax=Vitis vinifera TaxID=29760 RepID=A0A438IK86_VITVI|nr:hypothetical protein CK203_030068 [Vitis vinifera]